MDGEHKGREREEEEGEEKETVAVDAAKIAALLGTFFVVWCFCSPHHSSTSSKYKREKRVDIQHWCGEARQMTKRTAPYHCCHLCVGGFYAFSSQGQSH